MTDFTDYLNQLHSDVFFDNELFAKIGNYTPKGAATTEIKFIDIALGDLDFAEYEAQADFNAVIQKVDVLKPVYGDTLEYQGNIYKVMRVVKSDLYLSVVALELDNRVLFK
jgi:hypothetical protein